MRMTIVVGAIVTAKVHKVKKCFCWLSYRRNVIQQNDTQHKDTQHNKATKVQNKSFAEFRNLRIALSVAMLSVFRLSVVMLIVVVPNVVAPS